MSKTAFVTGGTGFLGINLIKVLCKANWQVTALHRSTSNLKYIKEFPVQLVEGSITDKASLIKAIPENTEVVFHVAGDTSAWSKKNTTQTAIHVDGTRNIIEVAVDKDVKTFIHTSSVSVWGQSKGVIDEETPQLGATSWINYEKTKWQAEQLAFKGMDEGLKVVSVNPGSIVGAYDTRTFATLFYALRDGKLPGIPPGTCPIVHVNDVVQAHILAVEKGQSGHRYIIVGEHISMKDFITEVAHLMGQSKVPSEMPGFVLKIVGRLAAFGAHFTGKEPTLTPEIADMLTRKDFQFSNVKALKKLGYQITPWKLGVKDCYEWLVKEGLL